MLTGSELLAKVKELGDVSKSELVRSCGYVSAKKDGAERLNFTAFYEALLEAKGLSLGDGGGKGGGDGGGEGGGGEGGGGEGASNTCDVVPTPLTEVMVTPRLAESWVVLPPRSDTANCEEARDDTMMVT